MCVAFLCNAHSLLFVICFVASREESMTASAGFIAGQSTGLTGSAAHHDKHIHPRAALGTFYLGMSGRVLSFMASVDQHFPASHSFFKMAY